MPRTWTASPRSAAAGSRARRSARSACARARTAAPRSCRRAGRAEPRVPGSRAIERTSSAVSAAPFIRPPLNSSVPNAPRRVVQRLGGERRVAGDERQRRRPLEQRLQHVRAGLVGGALGQRVLDDPEARLGLAQPACAARPPRPPRCRGSRPRRSRRPRGSARRSPLRLLLSGLGSFHFSKSNARTGAGVDPIRTRLGAAGSRIRGSACSGLTRSRRRRSRASSLLEFSV